MFYLKYKIALTPFCFRGTYITLFQYVKGAYSVLSYYFLDNCHTLLSAFLLVALCMTHVSI